MSKWISWQDKSKGRIKRGQRGLTRGKTATGKDRVWNQEQQIRSALRMVWRNSPLKKAAVDAARVERGVYACARCDCRMGPKDFRIDHIEPATPMGWQAGDWTSYVAALFCDPSGLQCLCEACHKKKTAEERLQRKKLEQRGE